jgi:glycosyltransferase involved in cell wall biosynthesis
LKILIITFYFEPDLSAGSFRTTALVNEMLDQLSRNSHIEVITTAPNRYSSFTVEAPEFKSEARLTVNRITVNAHKSGMIGQSLAFIRFAKGVINLSKGKKYDLIFATSSRLMTAVLGAYVSSQKRIPLYLDIRDIFVDSIKYIFPVNFGLLLKPIFSILEGWTIRKALKVNLVSAGFMLYFKNKYPNQQFKLFTNGIDEIFINNQPKKSIIIESKILNVVYAGNIGEGQGLHKIIPKLAQSLTGRMHFKLIGDGGRKQQLIDAIKSHGCNNVEILPPVHRDELIKIYKDADILFLHLNDFEAFKKVLPSKLFEYSALGKPIWAGVGGYAANFLVENISNCAVFEPCNVNEAIRSFDCLEMITQPRNLFVDKFSRANIMKKMAANVISLAK